MTLGPFWAAPPTTKHNEIGFADPADPYQTVSARPFTNQEQEIRTEVQLCRSPGFAELTTALGVQAGHQELTAPGDTPGLSAALWTLTETGESPAISSTSSSSATGWKAQIAGRIENGGPEGVRARRARRLRHADRAQPQLHTEERRVSG